MGATAKVVQQCPAKRRPSATKSSTPVTAPDGYKWVPPDGGYAWVVACTCFFCGMVTVTALPTFSVILQDLIVIYDTNTATVSWVAAICISTGQFLGPVITVMVNTYGCRRSTMAGGAVIAAGMTASYFATSIFTLCLTYGVIIGIGSGVCHTCYPIVLSQYFRKYYGIGIGLLTGGMATSRLLTTWVVQYILEEYGCRAVFLLMGAHSLHICVGASLFQPAWRHWLLVPHGGDPVRPSVQCNDAAKPLVSTQNGVDDKRVIRDKDVVVCNGLPDTFNGARSDPTIQQANSLLLNAPATTEHPSDDEDMDRRLSINLASSLDMFGSAASVCAIGRQSASAGSASCLTKLCGRIDCSLLAELDFYVVCLNGLLCVAIMIYSNVFLFPLAVEMGNTPTEAASIVSAKAIADIVSRIGGPPLVTFAKISHRMSYIVLGIVHGILLMVVAYANSFNLLTLWAIASGLAFGVNTSTSGVLILKMMGAQRMSSVLGLGAFVQGFFVLPMAPAMGLIRDETASFVPVFHTLAAMQFLLAILWIAKPYFPKKGPASSPTPASYCSS